MEPPTPHEAPGGPGPGADGPVGAPGRGSGTAAPPGTHEQPSRSPSPPQPRPLAPDGRADSEQPGRGRRAAVVPGDEALPPAPATGAPVAAHLPDPAEPAAAQQTDRLRYLQTATRQIARGVDVGETLCELCRAAIPVFADAILVHLREPLPVGDAPAGTPLALRLYCIAEGPEEPVTDVRPGTSGFSGLTVTDPLAGTLLDGQAVFGDAPELRSTAADLLEPVTSVPETPLDRRLIVAPLLGPRHLMGTVVLLRVPDRAAFTEDDLLVASQLAAHSAFGVDKAVVYGREASVADALQLTMLPSSLPSTTGVRLASRYLPAAETAQVGGDWYDAIPLPGNRVALVVGDVMGHSMTSAAIMGQLRTTVQTLAGLDLPPDEVLHHLDEQAQRLGTEHMATCLYAIYDPISHRLLVADAGHPPPVLLHPDGTGEVLQVPPGAPIGVGGVPFESVEMPAPTGATLVLYTDGLVESRERDVSTGVELLRARLHAAAQAVPQPPLESLCDEVLDITGPGARDDDVALLAARFDGFPPLNVAYWFLGPHARTPGRARELTRRVLERWGLESMLDTTELMVSEVVTNAVRYASRPIALRLLRTDVLRCEVGDDSPQVPRMRRALAGDEGGRGLFLVDQLARRWGATRLSTGKVVWFEQPIPEEQRRGGSEAA
ncbi:SpoIIE family protein phosphatase [Streptomyces sp. bgisy100]|uniref:SpoIIE family protein phosphatase n=1 Tax=Streptomyces sp. bgisy100 TaxID=3413783 RepID=UPI003D72B998